MKDNFQSYSKYYDLIYRDKDYVNEAAYITGLLRKHGKVETILEYGAGTGNHAFFLCKEGFKIAGLEKSVAMVNIGKQKNIKGLTLYNEDITSYELNQKFDAVIALFHVISYLTDNADLLKCFTQTNRHLNNEGFFIFDIWYLPAVYHQRPMPRIKKFEDDDIAATRFADPVWHYEKNTIDVNYEVIIRDKRSGDLNEFKETHPMRYFSIQEIEVIALSTGFQLVNAEEFMSGKTPGIHTWGVCFILKKIKAI